MIRDKKRGVNRFDKKIYLSALVFILIVSSLLYLLTHSGLVSISGNFNQNLFSGLSFGVPETTEATITEEQGKESPIPHEKEPAEEIQNKIAVNPQDNTLPDNNKFQTKGFEIADSVSKCMAISSPGDYLLDSHLSGADISTSGPFSTDHACLKIESNNVVLDCNGFNMTNDGTANAAGIIVPGNDTEDYTNVTIKNCPHVSEYRSGVVLYKTSNDTIYNITSHNNTYYGIYIESSSGNNISSNHVYNNSNSGIMTYSSSSDNFIDRNIVHHNHGDAGIHSSSNCVRNTYQHNVVYSNNGGFRTIMSCNYATYINNSIYNNDNHGIVSLSSSNYHNSTGNRVYNNRASGIYLSTSLRSNLESNEVFNNTNRGIDILNSDHIVMNKNTIYGNGLASSSNFDFIVSSTTNYGNVKNTVIYTNKTDYPGVRYFRQVGTASPANSFYNITICYNETTGCTSWAFVNLTEALLSNSTYLSRPDFVSLNDSYNPELNISANITLSKNISCSEIKYFQLSGFPQTKKEISDNGTIFTPDYSVCNDSTNKTTFQVSSFSGYTSNSETYVSKNLNISVIYPESNLIVPLNTFFKFVVNVTCLSGDCGDINISLDPPLGNYSLDLNNVTADVKYGSSGTGPNGGGQIKWVVPSTLHGMKILNASLCFHNRDNENDQFLKTIWLINESDDWDESSSAAVLNNQQKVLAVNVSSSCGSPNCIACHNVTALMQKAADLEYTNVTFRIEAAELHLSNINSVTNNDGLEPGTYWVFDDREISQSRGGPMLNITYGVNEKGLVSNLTGSTPFYTNSSNPLFINLNNSQSQIITFWMNATQTGTHELFVIINRTSPRYESGKSPSRNITILGDEVSMQLISPADVNSSVNFENVNLQCNASNYFGVIENVSFYDSAQGWNLIETKYPGTQTAQVNFSRNYNPNQTFLDTEIIWNCLGHSNRSKSSFAPSNYSFSNWGLGNYSDSISVSNGKITAMPQGYLVNTQERHDLTINVDPYMSSDYDPVTGRTFYAWAEENSTSNVDQLWTAYLESDNTGWTEAKRTSSDRDRNFPSMDIHNDHVYITYMGEDTTNFFQNQIWLGAMNLSAGEWNETQLTNYSDDVNWPEMVINENNNQIYISFIKNNDLWLGIYNITNGNFTGIELNDSYSFQHSPLALDSNRNKLYFLTSVNQGGNINVSYVSTNLDGSNYTQKNLYSSSGWALEGFNDIVYDPVSDNIYYSVSRLVSGSNWDLLKGVCDYDGENCRTELINSSASTLTTYGRIVLLNSTIGMTWIYGTQVTTPYNLELYAAELTRNDSFSILGQGYQKTNNNDETAYYSMTYDPLENRVRIIYQTGNSDVTNIYGLFTADWSLEGEATYTSRIMNQTNPLTWINFSYVSNEPPGTEIDFEFRTSDNLNNWTNWTPISNLSSNDRARYFQYRALMNNTFGPANSPSISQVQVSYDSEPYPEVILNSPANLNHTVDMNNVTFNCSVIASDSELVNVSLYSNQNGNWELIETQSLSGQQGQGIFNYDLSSPYDFRYKSILWNCLAYNNYSNPDWGNSNFIFDSWERGAFNNTQVSSSGSLEISSITSDSEYVDYWNDLTLSGNRPMSTALPALVWDPINQQLVLFGGQEIDSGNYLDETWIFHYHNQTWENVTASTVPPDFDNNIQGAGYNDNLNLIVALADSSIAGQLVAWYYNNSNRTWSYQNTTNLPSPDTVRARLYDDEENRFVLLANVSNGNNYMFFYDPANDSWTNVSFGTSGPRTQQYMAAVADPEKDIYLFFGGSNSNNPPWTEYNNTWIYNKTSQSIYELTGLSQKPQSRTYNNKMVYDPNKKVSVLFGGGWFDGVANVYSYNDTWYFNSTSMTWSRQNFNLKPPGVAAGGMEYIPHPDYSTIVLGGGLANYIGGTSYQNEETWELKYYKNYSTEVENFSQTISVSNGTTIEDWTAYLSGSGTVDIEGNSGTNWPGVALFNTSNESTDASCLVKNNADSIYILSQKARIDSITGTSNPGLVSIAVMSDNYYPIQNSSEIYSSYKLAIVGLELLGSPYLVFEYINNSQEALFWEFDNNQWSLDPMHGLPISYNSWHIHELRKNTTHYILLVKNVTTGFTLGKATLPLSKVQDGYGHDNLVIGESIEDWETGILQVDDLTYKYEGEASGQGQFISEEFDSQEPNEWYILWNETIFNNSNIIFKGRSSDNAVVWSNWFDIDSNPSGAIASNSRYFQFKSILNSTSSSPLLNEVGINYSSECVDNDNDGFGTGYTSKCSRPEFDCNDNDASVIPPYYGMNISQDTTFCSGIYNLTGPGDAITINNSDVTLICNQTIIVNSNTSNDIAGIYFNGKSNINIDGCVIQNYKKASIKFENSQNIDIVNSNLTGGEYGLWGSSNTSDVYVYNNYLAHNNDSQNRGYGLVAQNGVYDWIIRKNYVANNSHAGIAIYQTGSGNLIENNTCIANGAQGGIGDFGINDTIIRNNLVTGHHGDPTVSSVGMGIVIANNVGVFDYSNSNNAHVYNNTVYHNDAGISILGNNSLVEDNTIYNNTFGIYSQNTTVITWLRLWGHNNTVRNNNIHNNTYGIFINGSDYNKFINNKIENSTYGIYFLTADNSTIYNNQISDTDYSIFFAEDDSSQSCGGFVLACGSFGSQLACNNQHGCFWLAFPLPGQCTGSATPCNQLSLSQCTQQMSCSLYTNYYNTMGGNISNNILSNGIEGMHLMGKWSKSLIGSNIIKGGYYTVKNNQFNNFNTGLYVGNTNHNNFTNNIFSNNQLDIKLNSTQLANQNYFKNTLIEDAEVSFDYLMYLDINNSSMKGTAPEGYNPIGKFLEISNFSSHSNMFMNISFHYNDSELGDVNESTLKIWRYNGSHWAIASTNSTVNTAQNYVNAYLTNFSTFAPMGELPAAAPGWSSINYPEGIYEPENSTLPGTHLSEFRIKFIELNSSSNNILECMIQQTDNSVFSLNQTLITNNYKNNVSLNYTIQPSDSFNNTKPWKIINCSLYNSTNSIAFTTSSNYNHPLNKSILVHNNTWTKFNSADADAFKAAQCFIGEKNQYFNNQITCDYVGDVNFAVSMATGFTIEGYCDDQIDNDANSDVDCDDRYCQGIPYSCQFNGSQGFSVSKASMITGSTIASSDFQTQAFGGTCTNGLCSETTTFGSHSVTYYYNEYVKPGETLKVRFDGSSYSSSSPIQYVIKDLTSYTSYGRYNDSYGLNELSNTSTSISAKDTNGHTGDVDLVLWVNLSAAAYTDGNDYTFTVYMIHENSDKLITQIPIKIRSAAPDAWLESDTGTGRTSPCSNSIDEDLDYHHGCGDLDCNNSIGGTHCDGSDAYCEYGTETTCYDCFDNDQNGVYDCADSNCDLKPGNYQNLSILCHYQGEGRNTYDLSVYPWTVGCADSFNNDQQDGIDCYDSTYCWGRGGTSIALPCPAYENNTAQWCHDNFNNDYQGRTDCAD